MDSNGPRSNSKERVKLDADGIAPHAQNSVQPPRSTRLKRTKSRMDIAAPEAHNLPWYVSWASAVVTAIIIGILGWLMAWIDTVLVGFKYNFSTQGLMESSGLFAGAFALVGISSGIAAVAASMTFFFAPVCAGSGVPEAKGYMNGNAIPGLFVPQVLLVRTVAAVLAVAAGYPIGREGPMVGIGGHIGHEVVRFIARPFMKQWLELPGTMRDRIELVLTDDRRYGYAMRVGYVLGAAAGISVAFKAPIGGLLYVLQEATVTSWSDEITSKAFICCVLGVIVFVQIQFLLGLSIHRLLIFEDNPTPKDRDWEWADVPYFIVLATGIGWISALWSNGRFWVWNERRKFHKRVERHLHKWGYWLRYFKIYEAIFVAAFCALVTGLVPAMFNCKPCDSFCGDSGACAADNKPHHTAVLTTTNFTTTHASLHTIHSSHATTHSSHATTSPFGPIGPHAGTHATTSASGSHGTSGGGSGAHGSTAGSNHGGSHGSSTTTHGGAHVSSTLSGGHGSSAHGGAHGSSSHSGGHGSSAHAGTHGSSSHGGGHGSSSHGAGHGSGHSKGHHCMEYVRYTCPKGSYHEMATLLLTNAEATVQHLFSREAHPLSLNALLITVIIYSLLALLVPGICVPMGSFVPSMLIGAGCGRLLGESLQDQHFLSDPGLYAYVGAAAFLGGTTHFSVSIAMLLIEGSHDLNMVGPMMLANATSILISKRVSHHAYDERLIVAKKVPFLDAEMTQDLDYSGMCARDLMESLPPAAMKLRRNTPLRDIERILEWDDEDGYDLLDFPVFDEDEICIGMTKRSRLHSLVKAIHKAHQKDGTLPRLTSHFTDFTDTSDIQVEQSRAEEDLAEDDDQGVHEFIHELTSRNPDDLTARVPVFRIMDSTPYTILETFPVPRLYPLFIRAHCLVACVLSSDGWFKGIVTRSSLIHGAQKAAKHGHEHPHGEEEKKEVKRRKREAVARPRTHTLPVRVMVIIILLTVILIVATNFAMVWCDGKIVNWKFNTFEDIVANNGAFLGALYLAGCAIILSSVAVIIVASLRKGGRGDISGSGIPEAKGYINGNVIDKYFDELGHCGRVVCMVLAAAAGFPVGREGPMVAIGGLTGYFAAGTLAKPYVKRKMRKAHEGGAKLTDVFIDEERYAHAKLSGFILGAAAGIAVAFSAPIGGILYLFEEVTVTTWPPGFLFEVFFCTSLSVMLARLLQNVVMGQDFHRFVIFVPGAEGHKDWKWIDVPFVILLGAFVGTCSALYSKGLYKVWSFRFRMKTRDWAKYQPYANMVETVLYAAFVAMVVSLAPLLFGCEDIPHHSSSHGSHSSTGHASHGGRLLSGGGHGVAYVQYNCPDGQFNGMATLMDTAWEGAIKHLMAPVDTGIGGWGFVGTLLVYVPLAICMPGLSVPMGSFIPSMFIGALMGRTLGTFLAWLKLPTSHSGLYAVVGAGAFLGGFTQMTLAIVVLLIEATHDLKLLQPTVVGIFFGRIFARLVDPQGYDEKLIEEKNVPFLEAELPPVLEGPENTALSICKHLPEGAILLEQENVSNLEAALKEPSVMDFPVVNTNHVCIGTIQRARLEAVVKEHRSRSFPNMAPYTWTSSDDNEGCRYKKEDEELEVNRMFFQSQALAQSGMEGSTQLSPIINLSSVMNPSPYTVVQDMPVARFLLLFTKVGAHMVVVMNPYAGFVGMISKRSLIDAVHRAHHASHEDSHEDLHQVHGKGSAMERGNGTAVTEEHDYAIGQYSSSRIDDHTGSSDVQQGNRQSTALVSTNPIDCVFSCVAGPSRLMTSISDCGRQLENPFRPQPADRGIHHVNSSGRPLAKDPVTGKVIGVRHVRIQS